MDLILVAKAVGALAAIGVLIAVLLATAARKFHVEVDPRVEAVLAVLPGANCGACGNPSCFGAAEAIVAGTKPVNTCTAGGQAVADAVAELLGAEKCAVVSMVSVRHCGGGKAARRLFEYSGVLSCNAASRVAGGDLACAYGCLGYGDCVRACKFDAIHLDERGLPVVDLEKCTGCEACVRECPRGKAGLLVMTPADGPVAVRCCAHDKVKPRKDNCPTCCIACRKCEKACPLDAIHVIDMVAVVDYTKCDGCGACVAVCPQECIDLTGTGAPAPAATIDGLGAKVPGFSPRVGAGQAIAEEPSGSTGEEPEA